MRKFGFSIFEVFGPDPPFIYTTTMSITFLIRKVFMDLLIFHRFQRQGGNKEKMQKLIFFIKIPKIYKTLLTFLFHRYNVILFQILPCIEDDVGSDIEIDTDIDKVLNIDDMTVANQIDFKTLSTCKHFAIAFMIRIGNMVSSYTEGDI